MIRNGATWLRRWSAGILLGGFVLLSAGCASHRGVHKEVPYGTGYDYYYYPEDQVYFYPAGPRYYWYDHGEWIAGPKLPDRYRLHQNRRERLWLQTPEPWKERRFAPQPPPLPEEQHQNHRAFEHWPNR